MQIFLKIRYLDSYPTLIEEPLLVVGVSNKELGTNQKSLPGEVWELFNFWQQNLGKNMAPTLQRIGKIRIPSPT